MSRINYSTDFVEEIIKMQKDYFNSLQTRDYHFRIKQLDLLYTAIIKYETELMTALTKDLNKSNFESYSTEIGFVLKSIRYTRKNLKRWLRPRYYMAPYYLFGSYDKVSYQPLGISLIIGPFNYPVQLIFEPLIGAIAAGNCAIIKPSEQAENTAKVIERIIASTFDKKYICCLLGGVATTIALTHSKIDHIFFTGSSQVGRKIMQVASERLIPVTLELGGKSPVIVDSSANLQDAVEKILWGKMLNAGQTCVAPDYLIIAQHLKEDFVKLWRKKLDQFMSDDYGKIINECHFKRLENLLQGEMILAGGSLDAASQYIEPTLVEGDGSKLMVDEIFGPILPVLTYNDFEMVVSIIEQHPDPLALYIFSNNRNHIDYLCNRIVFGGGCINDCITHLISPKVPFGGIKNSGVGQYHGLASLIAFSHQQTLHCRWLKKDLVSLYPPYSKKLLTLVKRILR